MRKQAEKLGVLLILLTILFHTLTISPEPVSAAGGHVIDHVDIVGVTPPVIGELPTFDGITVLTPGVKIYSPNTDWYTKQQPSLFCHDPDLPFEQGQEYWLMIYVKPEIAYGYEFAENITATVNGQEATLIELKGTGQVDRTILMKFERLEGQAQNYQVTFDANGGSGTMPPKTITSGSTYLLPRSNFTPPAGKTFDAWDLNGERKEVGTYIYINSNKRLKALWKDAPLQIAVFRAGWSDTYKLGDTINLAARGEGGKAPYKYQFYVLRSNGSRVNFRKTPVSSNVYPWTSVTPDTYTLGVDVYDATGKKVTEEKTISVLPVATEPFHVAVFRSGWSDTYRLGQTINLAARGEGGVKPYKYQFFVLRSNGNRVNFRKTPVYSNVYPWTPVTPDTYTLGVDIYDASGKKVTATKTIRVLPKQ